MKGIESISSKLSWVYTFYIIIPQVLLQNRALLSSENRCVLKGKNNIDVDLKFSIRIV